MVLQSTLSKVDSFGTLRVHLREMSFLQMVIKNIASIVRRLVMKAGKTLKLKTTVLYGHVGNYLPVHAQSFFLFTNCD